MEKIIYISIGAVLGANARYWLGDWIAQKWGLGFPIGTMIINITGSLLLGFFLTLGTERFLVDPRIRLMIAVGFLGAYTTFSTFSMESFNLLTQGEWVYGVLNMLGSTLLGILAAGLGVFLARLI